jgi:cytochrome c-type biogenesis protein CcsB
MNVVARIFPWAVVGSAVAYLLVAMAPPREAEKDFHFNDFGQLPVTFGGRIQPLDSVARVQLMIVSKRTTYRDAEDKKHPAIQWLLETMARRGHDKCHSEKLRAFRIEDPKALEILGLTSRADSLYAYQEFASATEELFKAAARIEEEVPAKNRTAQDKALHDLAVQVNTYEKFAPLENPLKVFRIENDQVLNLLLLERRDGLRYSIDEFSPRIGLVFREAARADGVDDKYQTTFDKKILELAQQINVYRGVASLQVPTLLAVAPTGPGKEWQTLVQAAAEAKSGAALNPSALSFVNLLQAYAENKPDAFNRELDSYGKRLQKNLPEEVDMARFETFFNNFAPFYDLSILYVVVFVLACLAWIGWSGPLSRAAFWLAVLLVLVHTWAIFARMHIQGRPPVTNLYSSAIFIGWAAVILLLVVERIYRNGIANVLAAVIGGSTLIIAVNLLETTEDTMKPLQAVLDTNFWLATHVVCVTLGYAATLVAGALGLVYVVAGVFTPYLNRNVTVGDPSAAPDFRLNRTFGKAVMQILYGVICFAMLLSFTGTVLGGIWADQSWGRFWGWDPKENGAVLIVIMNALWLHARWGGILRDRGLAVLAIAGNIVTMWSWFGTNQLRIGLHSYGFNKELVDLCRYTWLLHLVFIGVGLVPLRWWRSLNAPPVSLPAPEPVAKTRAGRTRLRPAT